MAGAASSPTITRYENVRKVAYAIARYVVRAERPRQGILVGYDTRYGSEHFARVAAEADRMTGMPVWLAEEACPSPALSLLVRQRGAAGGIMITASHNPYRWNGMKFKASYGSSALPVDRRAGGEGTRRACCRRSARRCRRSKDLIQSLDMLTPYLETLEKLVDWDRLRAAKFRFVVDPMHGAARGTAARTVHASRNRLRRNSRHARPAFRRRQSRTDRAARRSVAPRRARRQI